MSPSESGRAELEKRIDDLQAILRLRRDDVYRLGIDLACADIVEAVSHLDSAVLLLGAARHHLDGQR